MKVYKYSVIVIGSGLAGLYTALKISEKTDFNDKILVVTKSPFGESNSRYAQGGIAAVITENTQDSVELHTNDTLKSGLGLCDERVVEYIASHSETMINNLKNFGINFDSDQNGRLLYARGGAHSVKRVLHCGGDATGMVIIKKLTEDIKNANNIDVLTKSMAVELIVSDNECYGAVIFNKERNEHEIVLSDKVILATGGLGQIYKYTTNPYGATGDGVALCYNAGAQMQDMEFVQFHPTALAINSETRNRFLISEAVRGEGTKLVNHKGEEFMCEYNDKKELASRDIVARAILAEMQKENKPNVFLKTNDNSISLSKRFPTIARKCLLAGIDITKEPIPVAPAAHYMIGGVKADLNGKTSVKNLYVVGELASTGFHGANRLASNSLLECAVCANTLAENLRFDEQNKIEASSSLIQNLANIYSSVHDLSKTDFKELKNELRDVMWNYAGLIRSEKSLNAAMSKIQELSKIFEQTKSCSSVEEYEFKNMLITAELVIKSALSRKESRGAHYRSDYQNSNPQIIHTIIQKDLC